MSEQASVHGSEGAAPAVGRHGGTGILEGSSKLLGRVTCVELELLPKTQHFVSGEKLHSTCDCCHSHF